MAMCALMLALSHLPATLLAAFLKRLARLCLSAPPAALVAIVPFTYNLLKRHPALMVLIHRSSDDFHGTLSALTLSLGR
jgi:U3 small nucleolar RNA-associated protein 19